MALSPQAQAWVRPELKNLEPYDPAFVSCDINLSANENTWPLSAAYQAAVREALATVPLNRYPEPLSGALREELAAWHGVAPQNILVGDGGDELIFLFLQAFGGPERPLLNCPPTFGVYEIYAQMLNVPVVNVMRNLDTFEPAWPELLDAAPKAGLAILTTPNNPTGNSATLEQVEALAAACPGLVMVDEAYKEFDQAHPSAILLIERYPNVAVLRTFSKAFGMAGVRLGYLVAHEAVIEALSAVRLPYSVGVLSQAAGRAALAHKDDVMDVVAQICQERTHLAGGLRALGLTVWPSQANFLLVRVPDAHAVRARLAKEHSILVRDLSATPGLTDCLRISVGTPHENNAVIAALADILSSATLS